MRAIQTKNLTETTRNSRKEQFCYGIEEHQNHKLTDRRRKFGELQSIYKKEKIKTMGWWNEINCEREKFSIQEVSSNKGNRQSVEEPLPKEKPEKDIENPRRKLYYT